MRVTSYVQWADRSPVIGYTIAIVCAAVLGATHHVTVPSTVSTLCRYIATRYAAVSPPVYSLVHRRPTEVCDSYSVQKDASLASLARRYSAGNPSGTVVGVLRDFDKEARTLLSAPCAGNWVWQPGSGTGHLYAQFARDSWAAWLFYRFGVTEASAAAVVLLGMLCGCFGIARLLFTLTGSNGVTVLTLVITLAIDRALIGWFELDLPFAWYGFSTAWLIVLVAKSRRGIVANVALAIAVSVNLIGYLMVAHSAAFSTIAVFLGLAFLVALAEPSRSRIAVVSCTAVLVGFAFHDCAQFVKQPLAPLSVHNFSNSGSFGPFALTTGFWTERPNSWSFPLGDFGVYATAFADPLIRDAAPLTFEYQGFSVIGSRLLSELLWRHPLEFVASGAKRLGLLVLRLPMLIRPTYDQSPSAVDGARGMAVVALVAAIVAFRSRARFAVEAPVIAICLWNFFGIEGLTHVVHTHRNYVLTGLLQLLIGSAFILVVLGNQLVGLVRRRPLTSNGFLIKGAVAVAVAAIALPYAIQSCRRELATFDVWYQPWIGVYTTHAEKDALLPDIVASRVEALRPLGEPSPGSISMYGAWLMLRLQTNVWAAPSIVGDRLGMSDDQVTAARLRAAQLAASFFRRAQVEAPNDPWVPAFATMVDPPSAVALYERALARSQSEIFSIHYARYITATVPNASKYRDLFDQLTHQSWNDSRSVRPGFVALPNVTAIHDGKWDIVDGAIRVSLMPGGAVAVGPIEAYATDRMKAFVYARVTGGDVMSDMELQSNQGVNWTPAQVFLPTDGDTQYRVHQWAGDHQITRAYVRFTAGKSGATILVRDLYPIIENPHVDAR